MASSEKVVADVVPSRDSHCGQCNRIILKLNNIIKCNLCNKVFHPSCARKIKKCCEEDLISLRCETPEMSNPDDPSVNCKTITNNSTHQDLLLRIISELEGKNAIFAENVTLLKYKISVLENDIINRDSKITYLQDKVSILQKKGTPAHVNNEFLSSGDTHLTEYAARHPPTMSEIIAFKCAENETAVCDKPGSLPKKDPKLIKKNRVNIQDVQRSALSQQSINCSQ